MPFPILQFGTSRFLQAHVDLFVSEARAPGAAAGAIAVVQTTASPDSRRRLAVFAQGRSYRVHVLGLAGGRRVDEWIEVSSIGLVFRPRSRITVRQRCVEHNSWSS